MQENGQPASESAKPNGERWQFIEVKCCMPLSLARANPKERVPLRTFELSELKIHSKTYHRIYAGNRQQSTTILRRSLPA